MLAGVRVRDLQRLAPEVLAGVLPRLYPQMLAIAYEHQDAGPADLHLHRRLAGDGRADGDRAQLRRRGRLGLRGRRRPLHRPRRRAVHLPRGQGARRSASWPRARASTSPRRGPTPTRSPTCRCCALVGHPVAVNPDAELRARRARGGLGDPALRPPRPPAARRGAAGARGRAGRPRPARRSSRRAARQSRAEPSTSSEPTSSARSATLARRFADERIAPHAADWDREHRFPRELFAAARRARPDGRLRARGARRRGRRLPLLRARARGALARRRRRRRDGRGAHERRHAADPRPRRRERYVPALARASELAAFALTEAGSGSDAGAMRTRVARRPHHGRQAVDHQRLARLDVPRLRRARTRAAASARFVVRAGADGFAVTREEEKLGLNSSSTADLVFEARPRERLGEPGDGHADRARTLDGGRIGIAAQAVGIAQAALDLATGYASERSAFGGPIARFGRSSRSSPTCRRRSRRRARSTWRAARLKEAGRPHTVEGAQAKLFASARRAAPDRRGDPGPRRLRLHEGVPGRALLPRRQGHRDLRGHERDPAAGDRARALLGEAPMPRPPTTARVAWRTRAQTATRAPRRRALVGASASRRRPSATRRSPRSPASESGRCTREDDLPDARAAIGLPGEYPFTRGVYPSMYRGRLWTMRQFAGFGTAEETNERFRYLLDHGQTGLSTAFDMPSLMGHDSDHPRVAGRGRPRGRRGRHARRHGDAVRRHRPRRGHRVDDDQRARRRS